MIKYSNISDKSLKKYIIKEESNLISFESFHAFMSKVKKQSKVATQKSAHSASKTHLI